MQTPRFLTDGSDTGGSTRPNNADAPNAAMALCLHSEYYWRGVGDLRRWAEEIRR